MIVVLWLVSANFRASVSSVAGSGNSLARGVIRKVVNTGSNHSVRKYDSSCISGIRSEQGVINYNLTEDSDDDELEALLVVRDRGKGKSDVSTNLDQEEDDGELV